MTTVDVSLLDQLHQAIDHHIDQPDYSIEAFCAELGVSRSRLFRVVKQQTGYSTTLYIRHRRLLRARLLLQTTALRITEVADQTGFSTSQDLSRYFAETFGCSPTEYRRQLAGPVPEQTRLEEPNLAPPRLEEPTPQPAPVRSATPDTRRRRLIGWLVAGAGLVALLIGLSWWYVRSNAQPAQPVALAVLPFQNLGSTDSQYFSDGVMEQTHALLTLVDGLKVISRTSSAQYAQTRKPLAQVARELGVTYLLTGRVRPWNNRVKLSVELVLANENQTVWSNTYEGESKEIFKFMSQTARTVADELNQQLNKPTQQRIDHKPTLNVAAFNEYLKGHFLLRTRTQADIQASFGYFDRALALDSTFADAYASKALGYFLLADGHFANARAMTRLAETNALIAIKLAPENSLAYAVLANNYRKQNQWDQSLTAYRIALRFSPNDALINYWYSLALRSLGRLDEAIQYSQKALDLDPLHPIIFAGHVLNCVCGNQLGRAERELVEGQRLFGQSFAYQYAKSLFYLKKANYQAALLACRQALLTNPGLGWVNTQLYYCLGRLGQTDEVEQYIRHLPQTPENYPALCVLYSSLGQLDKAQFFLQRCAETGQDLIDLLVNPLYAPLRQLPYYQTALRTYGLPVTPDNRP